MSWGFQRSGTRQTGLLPIRGTVLPVDHDVAAQWRPRLNGDDSLESIEVSPRENREGLGPASSAKNRLTFRRDVNARHISGSAGKSVESKRPGL